MVIREVPTQHRHSLGSVSRKLDYVYNSAYKHDYTIKISTRYPGLAGIFAWVCYVFGSRKLSFLVMMHSEPLFTIPGSGCRYSGRAWGASFETKIKKSTILSLVQIFGWSGLKNYQKLPTLVEILGPPVATPVIVHILTRPKCPPDKLTGPYVPPWPLLEVRKKLNAEMWWLHQRGTTDGFRLGNNWEGFQRIRYLAAKKGKLGRKSRFSYHSK